MQAGTVTGGNSFHAELATARVLKSRQVAQRSVHFVTFPGTLPHIGDTTFRFGNIYVIEHTDDGCRIIGEAGGGGDPSTRSGPWSISPAGTPTTSSGPYLRCPARGIPGRQPTIRR